MCDDQNGSQQTAPPADGDLLRQLRALVDSLRGEVAGLRDELSDLRKKPSADLSPAEAAERLGISRRTLDELEARGEITAVQVGGQVRYEACELADFIRRNRREDDRG